MTRYFDSDIELPWPTKLKLARYALAAAVVAVGLVGALFTLALDSFEAALANLGFSAPNLLAFPTILSALFILVVLFFLGFYYALSQYAQKHIAQLSS